MFESVEQLEKEVKEFQQNILASSELVRKLDEIIAEISAQERAFAAESADLVAKIDGNTEAIHTSQAEALKKLLDENQSLTKHLSDTTAELNAQMGAQVEAVKADHQELVKQLAERTRAMLTELSDKGASLLSEIKTIPAELDKSNSALSDSFQRSVSLIIEAANSMNSTQKAQAEALSTHCDNLLASMNEANRANLAKAVEEIGSTQKEYIHKIEEAEAEITSCKADLSLKYDEFLKKLESTNVDQMFKLCQGMKQSINVKLAIVMSGVGVSLILALISLFIR